MEIKVLTFNIHHGKGTDGTLDLGRIAEVVRESGADVIGLNEVDKLFARRSGYADQLQDLADQLNMYSAFGASVTLQTNNKAFLRQYGNALLSRYPIAAHTTHPFRTNKGLFEGRSLLEADIQVREQRLKAYVTHLSLTPWQQRKQADFILEKQEQAKQPVMVMGDCNMRPGTKAWRKITSKLTDVCYAASAVSCPTFPSVQPRIQLDYIFVSKHFQVHSAQVIHHSRKASDHLPIRAVLQLNDRI